MSKDFPWNETKLLYLLRQGNELAFTQLYNYFRPKVYGVALKMLKSPELAQEIVQEVFLKIWQEREKAEDIRDFENFLFIITRNRVLDALKKKANEAVTKKELTFQNAFENKTDFPVREKQYEELLARVTEHLPPQQKIVFELAKTQGLSHKSIAEQLQISPLTVKKHMAAALKFIRSHFQHYLTIVILWLSW